VVLPLTEIEDAGHENHLCELFKRGETLASFAAHVQKSQYVCQECGRVAHLSESLCEPRALGVTVNEADVRGSWFEIFKDAAGKFRFRLKAPNGEIIAASEAYENRAGCENGIASVAKNAVIANIRDLT
jgi:uncharacterized protein YegP (UPF0339 family)